MADSDDDGFPKQGGEALEIGDDFDSEEEADDGEDMDEEDMQNRPAMQVNNVAKAGAPADSAAGGKPPEVKG